MHWTRAGDHVLFVATRTEPPWEEELWLVPVNGGEARRLDGIAPDGRNAVLHPNGRRLTYKSGQNRGEIWVLELGAGTRVVTSPDAR
jgi:Tol biopolymer transport system component